MIKIEIKNTNINKEARYILSTNKQHLTNFFTGGDIKVRICSFEHFMVGDRKDDFIHIFANIMEGRTVDQKKKLSKAIISKLKSRLPDTPVISINIRDFEKATYVNKSMI